MSKVQIMDVTVVCRSFPELPIPQIHRSNILDTIDNIFEGATQLIMIEGDEGIGKTTLLAQFALQHPHHTFSLFIRPSSRWAYDPLILKFDLCNQLEWVLHQQELPSPDDIHEGFLRLCWLELQKRAKRERRPFYFAVDGLDEIPLTESQTREFILEMLPIGLPGFRFLISGDLDHLLGNIPGGAHYKSYPLSRFTLDETIKYLQDLIADQQSLEEIHRTCQGIPGYLASVRRILQSGTDIHTLLTEMPQKLPDLFEIEWRDVRANDDNQLKLLAIMAHDHKRHFVASLARLLNLETKAIYKLVEGLGFLRAEPENGEVSFVSDSFRKFAADQLRHLKETVNDLLINDLLRDPSGGDALTYLPGYLEQAGRLEDLLNYLSPEHFARMLEYSQSLGSIQQKAELGIGAARELHRDGDLMRFSIQKSVVTELAGSDIWRSEIEALMALDNYEPALALAQSAFLKEDRLQLLAAIAKAKRKKGLSIEPELEEQIQYLYQQIDYASLGERGVEIAADLIYCDPGLAVDLVEKSSQSQRGENSLDWAFANLSLAALSAKKDQPKSADAFENIRSRIKDPEARRFSSAVSLFINEYSAAEVIAEAEKLDGTSDRLLILRIWAMENRERDDAADVVDYALKLTIRAAAYAPNARVLREIATPLPNISDATIARRLVGSFDSQKGAVEHLGPTQDYVRLQLLLAQAESKYDPEAASNRVVDVYFYISDLGDLSIKAECMARLVASLGKIEDPERILETKEKIYAVAESDLHSNIESLLNQTAEHYLVTRGIVKALVKTKPDAALNLALALNLETRRDQALLEIVKTSVDVPVSKLNLDFLRRVIGEFKDSKSRDEAILAVLDRLSDISEKDTAIVAKALPLISLIESVRDATLQCRTCCLAYCFLTNQDADEYSDLCLHLLEMLNAAWSALDVGWVRVDVGFKIAESLADCSLERAQTYISLTEKLRDETSLGAEATAFAYMACLQLAISAYSGLLPRKIDTQEDLHRIAELINLIPSHGERAGLWSRVALNYQINGRLDDCKRVVAEHVRPLLQILKGGDKRYLAGVVSAVAPALYYSHKLTALDVAFPVPAGIIVFFDQNHSVFVAGSRGL